MPAALPYMPFYIGDYLADTVHLSTVEHGAYLLLLFHYWKRGEALPSDPERLRLIAGVSRATWRKISIKISEFFEQTETHWFHKRVEGELERARLKSLKSQAAGRKSGAARSVQPVNVRSTSAEQTLNMSDSESEEEKNKSSSSLRSEEPRASESAPLPAIPRRKRKPSGAVYCDDPTLLKAFDAFWEIYPRKKERQFALETWVREIRPEFVPDVIQAAIRYAELRLGEPEQFTRHAATWLNKGRWRDSLTDEKPKPAANGNGNGFKTRADINAERHREAIEFITGRRPIPGDLGDSAGGFDVFSPRPTAPRRAPAPRQLVGANPGQRANGTTRGFIHPSDAPTLDAGDVDPERGPRGVD